MHPDEDPPDEALALSIWRELRSSSRHRCVGAFVGDEMIASCMLTVIPNLTRAGRPYGVIENVVTHGDHRRRGHGRRVLEEALSLAWAERCCKVVLTTGRHDAGIARFYRSAGFAADEKQAFVARPVD